MNIDVYKRQVYTVDGKPFQGDPRNVLKRAIQEAADMGYVFDVGPECEFFLFHTDAVSYTHLGKTYEMSQHGFARDMEFVPVSKTKDSIVMNLTDTKETLEKYPFHFELQCSFTLKGSSIEAGWKAVSYTHLADNLWWKFL